MKTVEIVQINSYLREYLEDLGEVPAALLINGEPVAVLMPTKGADLETISLSLNPKFLKMMEESYISLRVDSGISMDDLRQELGLAKDCTDKPEI
ncbi:MAG TPA: hypothetical protein VJ183_11825 [Chloroflexia bacterium]|nr:hypothetical protein [Chloroflexia bacterium]